MRFSFSASISPANCWPWIGDRPERRRRAVVPDRIDRVALDRDQFRAGLGAGRGQPLGCRRSVQPGVKSEAVALGEVAGQPVFRGRIDQRLDLPGLAVDLLAGLQGVAAIDENRGLAGQHDGHAGRAGKAGQPGQPLLGGRDIFVLLLIGAGNHESRQLAPRQFLAECGEPRGQRDAAFGLLECLEMGFEHCAHTLGSCGRLGNRCEFSLIWHKLCLKLEACVRQARTICRPGPFRMMTGRLRGVSQLNDEVIHHACFYL